jgi:hypothetical protein
MFGWPGHGLARPWSGLATAIPAKRLTGHRLARSRDGPATGWSGQGLALPRAGPATFRSDHGLERSGAGSAKDWTGQGLARPNPNWPNLTETKVTQQKSEFPNITHPNQNEPNYSSFENLRI